MKFKFVVIVSTCFITASRFQVATRSVSKTAATFWPSVTSLPYVRHNGIPEACASYFNTDGSSHGASSSGISAGGSYGSGYNSLNFKDLDDLPNGAYGISSEQYRNFPSSSQGIATTGTFGVGNVQSLNGLNYNIAGSSLNSESPFGLNSNQESSGSFESGYGISESNANQGLGNLNYGSSSQSDAIFNPSSVEGNEYSSSVSSNQPVETNSAELISGSRRRPYGPANSFYNNGEANAFNSPKTLEFGVDDLGAGSTLFNTYVRPSSLSLSNSLNAYSQPGLDKGFSGSQVNSQGTGSSISKFDAANIGGYSTGYHGLQPSSQDVSNIGGLNQDLDASQLNSQAFSSIGSLDPHSASNIGDYNQRHDASQLNAESVSKFGGYGNNFDASGLNQQGISNIGGYNGFYGSQINADGASNARIFSHLNRPTASNVGGYSQEYGLSQLNAQNVPSVGEYRNAGMFNPRYDASLRALSSPAGAVMYSKNNDYISKAGQPGYTDKNSIGVFPLIGQRTSKLESYSSKFDVPQLNAGSNSNIGIYSGQSAAEFGGFNSGDSQLSENSVSNIGDYSNGVEASQLGTESFSSRYNPSYLSGQSASKIGEFSSAYGTKSPPVGYDASQINAYRNPHLRGLSIEPSSIRFSSGYDAFPLSKQKAAAANLYSSNSAYVNKGGQTGSNVEGFNSGYDSSQMNPQSVNANIYSSNNAYINKRGQVGYSKAENGESVESIENPSEIIGSSEQGLGGLRETAGFGISNSFSLPHGMVRYSSSKKLDSSKKIKKASRHEFVSAIPGGNLKKYSMQSHQEQKDTKKNAMTKISIGSW